MLQLHNMPMPLPYIRNFHAITMMNKIHAKKAVGWACHRQIPLFHGFD
jgi:hypothetical protein